MKGVENQNRILAVDGQSLSSTLPRSGCAAFDGAMDGIESLTLALGSDGFLVNSWRFQKAVRVAVEACENTLIDGAEPNSDQTVIETLSIVVADPLSEIGRPRAALKSGCAPRRRADFDARVVRAAQAAIRQHPTWPRDPWQVAALRANYVFWNVRIDSGRTRAAIRNALRGCVFADVDLVVDGPTIDRRRDSGRKRIEVRFDLLRRVSKGQAAALAEFSKLRSS